MLTKTGKLLDFTTAPEAGTTGEGLDAATITIIEQNTQTQIDHKEGYKEITWADGLPSKVETWQTSAKSKKLWTVSPTFIGGVPTSITTTNEDDSKTITTTIGWADGLPTTVERV